MAKEVSSPTSLSNSVIHATFDEFIGAAKAVTERIKNQLPYDPEMQDTFLEKANICFKMVVNSLPETMRQGATMESMPTTIKHAAQLASHTTIAQSADDVLYEFFGYRAGKFGRHEVSEHQADVRKSLCSLWNRVARGHQPSKSLEEKCIEQLGWAASALKKAQWTPEVAYAVNRLHSLASTKSTASEEIEVEADRLEEEANYTLVPEGEEAPAFNE